MQHFKKVVFFILIFLFFSPTISYAEESWVIHNFQSTIEIKNSGEVAVTEEITADFGTVDKHGIYRYIPYVYEDNVGKKTYTEIDILSVSRNDNPEKFTRSYNDSNLQIKIGDANRTIMGKNVYKISYIVKGVLRNFTNYDELYWNVTGNFWPVTVEKVTAKVIVADTEISRHTCYEGYKGSRMQCSIEEVSSHAVTFSTTKSLNKEEGLTVVVGYMPGVIPIITVAPPKTVTDDIRSTSSLVALVIGFIIGIGAAWYLWWSRGRDHWTQNLPFLGKKDRSMPKPLGAHETVVVEFESPEKLRPAELGVLMDERADTLDVTATIIDLAGRGFLTIKEEPKKWLFGSTDYILTNLNKKTSELLPYEILLLDNLFSGNGTVAISSLKKTFYDELSQVKKQLYKDVVHKKLFFRNPETIRRLYFGLGIGMDVVAGFLIFLGISLIITPFLTFGIGLMISSFFMFITAHFMPRRTANGRDLYRRAKGFKQFISGAEKYRQQFYERKNLFDEILPYTIMFGLTSKFAKAMKELGIEPSQPTWYTGHTAFNSAAFASDISNFSHSLSSAISSTPSSSGGFSSGGSSGGGFGGGGGGSW